MDTQPRSNQFLSLDLLCSEDSTLTIMAGAAPAEETIPEEQRLQLSEDAAQRLKQGMAHLQQGQYTTALAILKQSLKGYRNLGNRRHQAKVLLVISHLYYKVADYLWATDYGLQALSVAQAADHLPLIQQSLEHLGNSYRHLGDLQNALTYMNQSLQFAKQLEDQRAEMRSLNNLAMVYRAKGLARQAATLYEASLQMAEMLEESLVLLQVLQNLGNTYQSLHAYPQAIDCYERFLALSQDGDIATVDNNVVRRTLTHLINASLATHDYPRAIVHLRHHLSIAHTYGDHRSEDELFRQLDSCYSAMRRQKQDAATDESDIQAAMEP
jgi:tetratricopeptide (TPR) repeat protein